MADLAYVLIILAVFGVSVLVLRGVTGWMSR
ncbi:hypothetical protein SAMN05445060_2851 [Williamsia sterculiae]|uniref:Uncharacterized protein n=1 Tax=Williamsia sterculiae TaxID=1344003 RepID=A0A1N7GJ24_9NOCA|nr:hypothetical protein SAMN05445060_2851 [Williamsia sterculiae]